MYFPIQYVLERKISHVVFSLLVHTYIRYHKLIFRLRRATGRAGNSTLVFSPKVCIVCSNICGNGRSAVLQVYCIYTSITYFIVHLKEEARENINWHYWHNVVARMYTYISWLLHISRVCACVSVVTYMGVLVQTIRCKVICMAARYTFPTWSIALLGRLESSKQRVSEWAIERKRKSYLLVLLESAPVCCVRLFNEYVDLQLWLIKLRLKLKWIAHLFFSILKIICTYVISIKNNYVGEMQFLL